MNSNLNSWPDRTWPFGFDHLPQTVSLKTSERVQYFNMCSCRTYAVSSCYEEMIVKDVVMAIWVWMMDHTIFVHQIIKETRKIRTITKNTAWMLKKRQQQPRKKIMMKHFLHYIENICFNNYKKALSINFCTMENLRRQCTINRWDHHQNFQKKLWISQKWTVV